MYYISTHTSICQVFFENFLGIFVIFFTAILQGGFFFLIIYARLFAREALTRKRKNNMQNKAIKRKNLAYLQGSHLVPGRFIYF